MKTPAKVRHMEGVDLPSGGLHLAIGMFDGVHRGHQSVIGKAVEGARESRGIAGVLTFWPHPSYLVTPEKPSHQMMLPEIKERVLYSLGVDLIVEQPFTEAFAALTAKEFIARLHRCLPSLETICVGENWRFGRGRQGDASLLAEEVGARGVRVIAVSRVQDDGEPVSSSRIRECLTRGQIAEANRLLGYVYFSEGVVEEGRKIGRQLGFPTLNFAWNPPLKPRFGVYAVEVARADGEGGEKFSAVANYGVRPTIAHAGESAPLLEVFLLGESCPFGAGDRLRVEWTDFLRAEQRFSSQEELKAQIARDVATARQIHHRVG